MRDARAQGGLRERTAGSRTLAQVAPHVFLDPRAAVVHRDTFRSGHLPDGPPIAHIAHAAPGPLRDLCAATAVALCGGRKYRRTIDRMASDDEGGRPDCAPH